MKFIKTENSTVKRDGTVVTNTLFTEQGLKLDQSTLTGLNDPLTLFERGSFTMIMDWENLLKYEYLHYRTSTLKGPSVLDIGCRDGTYRTVAYRNMFPVRYTGIDIDKRYIDKQMEGFTTKDATFYLMNLSGKKLPFKDNEFDVVIATDVIEHVDSPDAGLLLLKEAIRVSKNLVFISTPNRDENSTGPTVCPPDYKNGKLVKGHLYEFSNSDIEKEIKKTGVTISERYGLLSSKKVIDKELELHPDVKKVFDQTMVKSGHLRNTIIAQLFPDSSKDVLYVLSKNI